MLMNTGSRNVMVNCFIIVIFFSAINKIQIILIVSFLLNLRTNFFLSNSMYV